MPSTRHTTRIAGLAVAARRVVATLALGAFTATAATGCSDEFDHDAYCAEVKRAAAPADLASVGDEAVQQYLESARRLSELGKGNAAEDWAAIADGVESMLTDGKVDMGKVDTSQQALSRMAEAANRLEPSVRRECGFGLSGE